MLLYIAVGSQFYRSQQKILLADMCLYSHIMCYYSFKGKLSKKQDFFIYYEDNR